MACNLNFIVKNEGVLKVTGSHVLFISGNVLKMVHITVHKQDLSYVQPFNSSNFDDLGCMSKSFIDCKLFSISVSHGASAIAELFVNLKEQLQQYLA